MRERRFPLRPFYRDAQYKHSGFSSTVPGVRRFERWLYPLQVTLTTHTREHCAGSACCLHCRTDHGKRHWPQVYRTDRGFTERMCPHGVGHPDPDDVFADPVHGCDGCCVENVQYSPLKYPVAA